MSIWKCGIYVRVDKNVGGAAEGVDIDRIDRFPIAPLGIFYSKKRHFDLFDVSCKRVWGGELLKKMPFFVCVTLE